MGAPQKLIGRLGSQEGINLAYPADIHNTPFACVLRFSKYQREISYNEGTQNPIGTILLPLPQQLAEATNIQHADYESPFIAGFLQAIQSKKEGESVMQAIGRMGADNLGLAANKGVEALGDKLTKMIGNREGALAGIGKGITNEIANAGKSGAITGMITNPHQTVVFSGVGLRGYNYSWNFSPRSLEESRALNDIFNYLRRAALPSYTEGKIGLRYPDEVQIDFIGNGIEEYVYGSKRSVITDVAINYAQEGHPTFYKSGAPTSVSLSITLKETAIRTADDYENTYSSALNARG